MSCSLSFCLFLCFSIDSYLSSSVGYCCRHTGHEFVWNKCHQNIKINTTWRPKLICYSSNIFITMLLPFVAIFWCNQNEIDVCKAVCLLRHLAQSVLGKWHNSYLLKIMILTFYTSILYICIYNSPTSYRITGRSTYLHRWLVVYHRARL